ncbi:fungal-specific transcription factor domain-containing protein [Hypoxylon sp. FL1857]|nr:fungal-specific transcription factor domain-containing protein [Hypoxylon sp. FL1857]
MNSRNLPHAVLPRHRPHSRSCKECYRRKLRCDRAQTCSNCARLCVTCVYTDEPIRRDRKSKLRGQGLVDRVAELERLVCQLEGQDSLERSQTRIQESAQDEFPISQQHPGRLIADKNGKSRLLANTFWACPPTEIEYSNCILGDDSTHKLTPSFLANSSYGSFLFPQAVPQMQIATVQPNLGQMRQLWGIYVQNVDPLVRILHKPSINQIINDMSLDEHGPGLETMALLLAICYSAVSSLPPSQARLDLSCDTNSYVTSSRMAAEKALTDAQLLQTNDLRVLQAFVIFLTCLPRKEARTIGVLISLAVRISRAMGLHRDGSLFNLSPFETELRRRLWWHLCLLDWRAAEDAGLEVAITPSTFDTKMPLNINDDDMEKTSFGLCASHGYTEMTFALVRYEAWSLIASWNTRDLFHLREDPAEIDEKKRALERLSTHLDNTYLRFCRSISTPISRALLMMGPLVIAKLRLVALYPTYRGITHRKVALPAEEKDKLFRSAIDLLEFEQLLGADSELRGWRWFFANGHIQWHAMSLALSELCVRAEGETENAAWDVIDRVFPSAPFESTGIGDNIWEPLQGLKQKALDARYSSFTSQLSAVFPSESDGFLFNEFSIDWAQYN